MAPNYKLTPTNSVTVACVPMHNLKKIKRTSGGKKTWDAPRCKLPNNLTHKITSYREPTITFNIILRINI